MMEDVAITIPGLRSTLPGKLPGIGTFQRWSSAVHEAGAGSTIAAACSLIGLCLLHVPAFGQAWRKAGDPILFGDAVFDLLLEGGAKLGGDNAAVKAMIGEQRRIQELMGAKLAPFIDAADMAAFSSAQTEPPTLP
jgi:hypothetical protein